MPETEAQRGLKGLVIITCSKGKSLVAAAVTTTVQELANQGLRIILLGCV